MKNVPRGLEWFERMVDEYAEQMAEIMLSGARDMLETLKKRCDAVTARWARSGRIGRVFAINGDGSLLLNFDSGLWSVEPGSTDAEIQANAN